MGEGTGSCDPDEYAVPDMTEYLRTAILANHHGYISRTHLEDLISGNHPPEFYLKRGEVARRRLVTKAMNRMNFENWSGRAWWIP